MERTPLRVGTDCSGIEAPIQALKQLNIPFVHEFSSEIDDNCRKSIRENYDPKIIYGDITQRKHDGIPDIDLYVAGFPCQPFSTAGKRKGLEDRRGNIFWSCFDVIKRKKPKFFILENVVGLLSHDKGRTWSTILNLLESLPYNIYWKILNTKDFGIPQDRKRLYIVGSKNNFIWPKPIPLERPLSSYISNDGRSKPTSSRHEEILSRLPDDSQFIEFAFGVAKTRSFANTNRLCPCITANPRIWCVPKHRYATPRELLNLQGFGEFKQVVSDTQLRRQIGNSMSVNVIKEIMRNLLL